MKQLLLFFIFLLFFVSSICAQTTVNYTETSDVFANPERGLQKYSITNANYNTTTGYTNLTLSNLVSWRTGSDRVTVIFRYFLINAFLNEDISTTYLANIQKDFEIIRNAGLKCIVRFSYSNAQSTSPQQPTKSQILAHIKQIAPVLESNKDIIFSHQAGFIGTWGEWYYTNSAEFGTDGSINATQWANRKEIIDAMLEATPAEIPIQVRYPGIKRTMYGTTQLTEQTAYQNTPFARIGFYNDAFLNKWGDMGTYGVGENINPIGTSLYNYLANETRFTPMTGETNGLNPPRTDGANALNEMNLTNWTTLNRDYFTQNFSNWINSGHYPDILRKLGYRFVLEQGKFQVADNQLNIELSIRNEGFARMLKQRKAWIILINNADNTQYPFLLETDPRTWEKGVSTIVSQAIDISDIPMGTYQCFLSLPDSDPELASRPEYSVRFANQNVWMSLAGYNNLHYSFIKTTTHIDDFEIKNTGDVEKLLSVFPNPATDEIYISAWGNNSKQSVIYIFSVTGQLMYSQLCNIDITLKEVYRLDVSSFSSGIYTVVIKSEGSIKHGKFVKL